MGQLWECLKNTLQLINYTKLTPICENEALPESMTLPGVHG